MLMTRGILRLILPAIAAAGFPAAAIANDDKPFSLVLSAGAEHDSNVAVEQTDTVSLRGDALAVLEADAKYRLEPAQNLSLTAGYDFEQTLHAEFSAFDMQTHTLSLGLEQRLGATSLAADYSFMHILLGGSGFLDMHQISPSVSGFAAKAIYLRGSFTYTDKNFKTANAFDARNYQVGADAYYFMMHNKAYVSLTGRYEVEDTTGTELAYKGFQLGANLQVPVSSAKVKLGYAYRQRLYDNVTVSIADRRHETRSVIKLSADVPLLGELSFKPEFRYIDRQSNYQPANYREYVETGAFSYRF